MSEPREGSWSAKPLNPIWGFADVNPYGNWIFRVVWLLMVIFVSHPATRLVLSIALVLLTVIFLGAREVWVRWPRRRTRTLLDHPPDRDEFLVTVTILSDARRLGSDRGVLWFENGAMGFSGERLSFLLQSSDLRQGPFGTRPFQPLPTDAIGLNLPGKFAFVTVRPIGRSNFAFRQRFRKFRFDEQPCDEPRQWPPLSGYDMLAPRNRSKAELDPKV